MFFILQMKYFLTDYRKIDCDECQSICKNENFESVKYFTERKNVSMKNLQDLRVQRTRKWLQEALLSLLADKPFSKISVAEITTKAQVSRPTFYLHYRTKEEVLEDYLDSIYRDFMDDMQPYLDSIIQGKMAVKLFEQIADQEVFLRSLINSEVAYLVMQKLHQYCYDVISQALIQIIDPAIENETWNIVVASIAGSVYAMGVQWLQMGMTLQPKEMGELTMRLISPGIRDVLMQNSQKNNGDTD